MLFVKGEIKRFLYRKFAMPRGGWSLRAGVFRLKVLTIKTSCAPLVPLQEAGHLLSIRPATLRPGEMLFPIILHGLGDHPIDGLDPGLICWVS